MDFWVERFGPRMMGGCEEGIDGWAAWLCLPRGHLSPDPSICMLYRYSHRGRTKERVMERRLRFPPCPRHSLHTHTHAHDRPGQSLNAVLNKEYY